MKVLIIGTGAISEMFHIPAAIKLLGHENVFLAENNSIQLKKMTEKFNIKNQSQNFLEFLPLVDFCILATPPHTHLEIIRNAIQFSKPILCEKPITLNFHESEQLITLQQESKLLIALCHTYRFFPNRNYIRNQVQSGFFGNQLEIIIEEGEPASWQSVSGYNFRKELVPGGVLLDAGIHSLDFILWCLGEPHSIAYKDDSLGGLESNCELVLEFEKNAKAIIKLSRTHNFSNKIYLKGSLNAGELAIFEMNSFVENGKETVLVMDDEQVNWENIAEIQLNNFIKAMEDPNLIKCDLISGSKVIKLIEKCYTIKKQRTLPEFAPLPGELF